MNMTREQKLKRADEIFAAVWGDEGTRVANDVLADAAINLRGFAAHLTDNAPNVGEVVWVATELRQLAERLDALDFSERVA